MGLEGKKPGICDGNALMRQDHFNCINQSVGIQLLKENNPFFSIRISPSFRLSLDQSLHNTLNARVDGISSARFRHNKLHINLQHMKAILVG